MPIALLMIFSGSVMGIFCVTMISSILTNHEIGHRERLMVSAVILLFLMVSAMVFVGGLQLAQRYGY